MYLDLELICIRTEIIVDYIDVVSVHTHDSTQACGSERHVHACVELYHQTQTHHMGYICVQNHDSILGTKEHLNMNVLTCAAYLSRYTGTYTFAVNNCPWQCYWNTWSTSSHLNSWQIYPSRCPRVRSLNFHDLYIVKPVIPMIAVFLTISHHEQSFPTHQETFDVDASASAGAVTCLSSFGSFIVVPTKCYKIYAIWYAFMYYSISYFAMIRRIIWLSLVLTKFHYSARIQVSISNFNGCIST